jgi:signal recognition particle receptor subunit beta
MGNCCSKILYFKILVLGPIMSGKTTLLENLDKDNNDSYSKEYFFYNNQIISIFIESIDDTITINQVYLKQVQGVILVIDLSRLYSNIVDQLNALIDFRDDNNLDFIINIVGTKADLANQLTMESVRSVSNIYHYPFFIASSRIAIDNSKVFDEITHEIALRYHLRKK